MLRFIQIKTQMFHKTNLKIQVLMQNHLFQAAFQAILSGVHKTIQLHLTKQTLLNPANSSRKVNHGNQVPNSNEKAISENM